MNWPPGVLPEPYWWTSWGEMFVGIMVLIILILVLIWFAKNYKKW
ncbi:MAG: hypothetical protein ACFFDJ_07410 [Candidatus Odinarchaeota archaeon]